MPQKKSEKSTEKNKSQKGKKGGSTSQKRKTNNQDDTLDYIEIDEFTLDDLTKDNN